MHFYSPKLPGVNTPRPVRQVMRVVSGDTLKFTVRLRDPGSGDDLPVHVSGDIDIRVVVAETRFSRPIWEGSLSDGWVSLDEHVPGLAHISVPRLVTSVLRRGAYSFSVSVDNGVMRETQATGSFQIEYEPGSPMHDIPYRDDSFATDLISISPSVDTLLQPKRIPTYEDLVSAVRDISQSMTPESSVDDAALSIAVLARIVARYPELATQFVPTSAAPTYDEIVESIKDMVRRLPA